MEKSISIVTGASRGIGYSTALELHRRGHHVLALARSGERLRELRDECGDDRLQFEVLDLSDADAVQSVMSRLQEDGFQIDYMINNAGAIVVKPFEEITGSELRKVYEVNVFSVFEMIQKCIPLFSDRAHVVNISSMGGFQGSQKFAGLSSYSSSKAAVASLTECLQEELGNRGWTFNALCLGAVQTEMLGEAFPGFEAPVNPGEMAGFICDFAETASKFIRGKVLPISSTTP